MTLEQLLRAIFPPRGDGEERPSRAQRNIIAHPSGPAWVIAGPGSGKTETLALLVLRLLYVDGVDAESIVVTTFTEKAARNIDDRIGLYNTAVVNAYPEARSVDVSRLRIGTLHGLCNDLLQEFRAPNYQNVRLMDEFETAMFVHQHVEFVKRSTAPERLEFWRHFAYLFRPLDWKPEYDKPPRRWVATRELVKLFNRVAEDRASLALMRAEGGAWAMLADVYEQYTETLKARNRCDFAHLQARFLEFLDTPAGRELREGTTERPPIRWVLVDEYQDTNVLQERIYLNLARGTKNIVVVGDDDQALYRFRGASVECMVTFDEACVAQLGVERAEVAKYPLVENFRSHSKVVDFCNAYVTAFAGMAAPGSRVPGKPPLEAMNTKISAHDYPAVGKMSGRNYEAFADAFAETIADLKNNGVIEDYSQCCLILRSTKEGAQGAGAYATALRARGIPYFNPRNKSFLAQEEVLALLGAITAITDPDLPSPPWEREIADLVHSARAVYERVARDHPELGTYVAQAVRNIGEHPGERVPTELQELLYLILALQPFRSWNDEDPVRRERLAKITALIEAFASLPVARDDRVRRGSMMAAPTGERGVVPKWNGGFYNLFFGFLALEGMNDEEDDDIIVPPGYVPIMTIHQAKGLQFPFVFVGSMGTTANPKAAVYALEDDIARFAREDARQFARPDASVRAEVDTVRAFYVAYSRAQWALILVGSDAHFRRNDSIPCGPDRTWLRYHAPPL